MGKEDVDCQGLPSIIFQPFPPACSSQQLGKSSRYRDRVSKNFRENETADGYLRFVAREQSRITLATTFPTWNALEFVLEMLFIRDHRTEGILSVSIFFFFYFLLFLPPLPYSLQTLFYFGLLIILKSSSD